MGTTALPDSGVLSTIPGACKPQELLFGCLVYLYTGTLIIQGHLINTTGTLLLYPCIPETGRLAHLLSAILACRNLCSKVTSISLPDVGTSLSVRWRGHVRMIERSCGASGSQLLGVSGCCGSCAEAGTVVTTEGRGYVLSENL